MIADPLVFAQVSLRFGGPSPEPVLDGIDWRVGPGQRWIVLGANGSGKTSLLRLAGAWVFPTAGTVDILGSRLGRVDVRSLRRRIGFTSGAFVAELRPGLSAEEAVMTAKHAAREAWWHSYDEADVARARELLALMGCGHLAGRPIATASDGERQRIQLARTLMIEPDLVLLDEPTAGLDLGGREALVARLGELARDGSAPPTVLVTHHVEEIPPGFTHVLLLRAGRVLAAGPLDDVLTGDALSACFGLPVRLEHRDGRFLALGVPGTADSIRR